MHLDSTAPEEWRAVVGYEGWYEVSDHGRVRRVAPGPRTRPGRLLKPQRGCSKPGYWTVRLWNGTGRGKTRAIHLLMADAFLPPKPSPLHEINHRDLDSWNNHLTNLEWLLHEDNVRHAFRGGAVGDRRGIMNANARLTEDAVLAIRLSDAAVSALAERYGVTTATIVSIRTLKTWKNVHAFQSPFAGDRRGARHPRARLTDEDVRAIRAEPSSVTTAAIARSYGVSHETIRCIRLRTSWQHID